MTEDAQLKLLLAIAALCGSLIGAATSAVLFFWRESRERYLDQMAGLNTLKIMTAYLITQARIDPEREFTLTPEWLISHTNALMHKPVWFDLVNELIEQTVRAQLSVQDDSCDLSEVIQGLEACARRVTSASNKHRRSLKRFVFMA